MLKRTGLPYSLGKKSTYMDYALSTFYDIEWQSYIGSQTYYNQVKKRILEKVGNLTSGHFSDKR